MERLKRKACRVDACDILSLGLIATLFVIALTQLDKFPVFKDIYYHMGTTRAYQASGGISLFDFWEFAPAGRAQLYPPMLHVMMYVPTSLGVSMSTVGRWVSFGAFHLTLLSTWYGMRRLFSGRSAFYTTVVLASSFMFFWSSAVTSAASLVLIITPFVFIAIETDRTVAAGLLLALALYSHLVLGHLVALGIVIYAIHRRKMFKRIFFVLAGAYLLWLPWGIHVLLNYRSLDLGSPAGGGAGHTLHLLILAVALAGFIYCYFKKGRYYLLPSYLLGMVPILFFYPQRFWEGHSFVPLAMLGGVALCGLHGLLADRLRDLAGGRASYRAALVSVMALAVALFLLLDPVVTAGRGRGPAGRPGDMAAYEKNGPRNAGELPDGQLPPGEGFVPLPGATTPSVKPRLSTPALPGVVGDTRQEDGGPAPAIHSRPEPSVVGDVRAFEPGPNGEGSFPEGFPGDNESPDSSIPRAETGTDGPFGLGRPGGGMPMNPRDVKAPSPGGLEARHTTLLSLFSGGNQQGMHSLDEEPLLGEEADELARLIASNSEEDQIVFAHDASTCNMITGLTGRATTGGMFKEVQSEGEQGVSSLENASLLVVGADPGVSVGGLFPQDGVAPSGDGRVEAGVRSGRRIDLSSLEYVGSAGDYSVYYNPQAKARSEGPRSVIPWYLVFALLGVAAVTAAVDWFHPLHPVRRLAGAVGDGNGRTERVRHGSGLRRGE